LELVNVDYGTGKQSQKETEVPKQRLYALPDMRQIQSGLPQVQDLPDLLQNDG
jgi:hypothetical protein